MKLKLLLPISQTFEIQIFELEKYRELIELILLSTISFLVPVLLGHSQLLIGVIVNALIVRSALTMRHWKNLPTLLFPSLGVLTRGILFDQLTLYLTYLIPFIWFSNFVLAYCTKVFNKSGLSLFTIIVCSSALKTLVMILPTLFFIKFSLIPDTFSKSMGIVQFMTAVIGSTVAILVTRFEISINKQRGEREE